jgi:hypothetical protein
MAEGSGYGDGIPPTSWASVMLPWIQVPFLQNGLRGNMDTQPAGHCGGLWMEAGSPCFTEALGA